jgi:peptidyl-prolyl cis-trans isomerase SurA
MKDRFATAALVLALMSTGWAQLVASHATTQAKATTTPQPSVSLDKPVARVNGAVLTYEDLLREEYVIFPYARQHSGQIPSSMEAGIRDGAIKMIVFEELVYQDAQRRKITVPEAKLLKAKREFRSRFSSAEEYKQYLRMEFQGSEQKLTERIRRSLLIDSVLSQEVNTKSAVTPAELRAFYQSNSSRYQYPESFLIQTISFIPPQNATQQQLQEARKKAEAALPQAKAAKTAEAFGLLAEKVSEDDYHVMMGQHKPMPRSTIVPELLPKLLAMKDGDVTDIIQIGPISTIIRLNKHIMPGKRKFAEVKDDLKKELQTKKTNQVRAALDKKLRQNAKVEIL